MTQGENADWPWRQQPCPGLTACNLGRDSTQLWPAREESGRCSEGQREATGVTGCFMGPMHLTSRVLNNMPPNQGHV